MKYLYNKHYDPILGWEFVLHKPSEFQIGLEITDDGKYGDDPFLVQISSLFFTTWLSFPFTIIKRKKDDYRTLQYGSRMYLVEGSLVFMWNFGQDAHSWSKEDPWWRHTYIDVLDSTLGRWKGSSEIIKHRRTNWTDPLTEKVHPCVVEVEKFIHYRKRIPFVKRIFHRISIDFDINNKGIGVSIPGKGDNSWDCEDTHTSSLSIGIGDDSVPDDYITFVKDKFTESIIDRRKRHGGPHWKPDVNLPEPTT